MLKLYIYRNNFVLIIINILDINMLPNFNFVYNINIICFNNKLNSIIFYYIL